MAGKINWVGFLRKLRDTSLILDYASAASIGGNVALLFQ
jgi:hypothetical protein